MRQWQRITLALMICGYAGYYVCRSNLSIVTPILIKEFGGVGINKPAIGNMVALATLFYAFGKFVGGSLADKLGGRRVFLVGMGGSILCTLFFAVSGTLPLFTLAWSLNRLVQSMGWAGMVRISSRWYSYTTYGAVMGAVSLSFLFGDFFSRQFLSLLVSWNMGWRAVFYSAAGTLALLFVVTLFMLKESPKDIGEPEPLANPESLFGEAGSTENEATTSDILKTVLQSPIFWLVCVLSIGVTLVRETFNTWTPQYLTEVIHMAKDAAGRTSSYFPLFGGISVILCGYLSDRLGRAGRAAIIFVGLVLTIPALLVFAFAKFGDSVGLATLALGTVAFMLLGPYSFLAGAIALDFGGKKGSATVSGWVDGMGYLGGIASGKVIGELAQKQGWSAAFLFLTVVTVLTAIAAGIYWRHQHKQVKELQV
jgi:OPA family glycerol-3-phosphate transporter-like MFS transporter